MWFAVYFSLIRICWNSFCFFVIWLSFVVQISLRVRVYNSITLNHWTIQNICSIFTIFLTTCTRIPHRDLSLFHFWFDLHFPTSNLDLHSHYKCFVNIFDSFAFVIILSILRFKCCILFGTHNLSDRSLRVLKNFQHIYLI